MSNPTPNQIRFVVEPRLVPLEPLALRATEPPPYRQPAMHLQAAATTFCWP